jgi:signal transduction histidine kinase
MLKPTMQRMPSTVTVILLVTWWMALCPASTLVANDKPYKVVVLYPDMAGRPGIIEFDTAFRKYLLDAAPGKIEYYYEYLDAIRFPDQQFQEKMAQFLEQKYTHIKPDLVVVALKPSLDFIRKHHASIFPNVPIVVAAVEEQELENEPLLANMVGVPMKFDIAATLQLALGIHPQARKVYVVTGCSKYDQSWKEKADQVLRQTAPQIEFIHLTHQSIDELVEAVKAISSDSIIYYMHMQTDRTGASFSAPDVLAKMVAVSRVPIYGHLNVYLRKGIVGGKVMSFASEGKRAAWLITRLMQREKLQGMIPASDANPTVIDAREYQRWVTPRSQLPADVVIDNHQPGIWEQYRWQISGGIVIFMAQTMLIAGLLAQRYSRKQIESRLETSQKELIHLTGKMLTTQESESRRIARELHDDLNQNLALVAMELDLLSQPGNREGGTQKASELSIQVKKLSTFVHALSHQLHPAKLEQLGLVKSLRSLCRELSSAHEVVIDYDVAEIKVPLPSSTALCFYRIAQEALSNAIKHSESEVIEVQLQVIENVLTMTIQDDGKGFDPEDTGEKQGLGLLSMRERVRLEQGTVQVMARPGEGTRIEVHAPLNEKTAEEMRSNAPTEPVYQ